MMAVSVSEVGEGARSGRGRGGGADEVGQRTRWGSGRGGGAGVVGEGPGLRSAPRQMVIRGGKHSLKPDAGGCHSRVSMRGDQGVERG